MSIILHLRGRPALSGFRLTRLQQQLSAIGSPALSAEHWHFVETTRPLDSGERAGLDRLLTYGPQRTASEPQGRLLLVLPRFGTISPWSSKATDIARNCGLDAIVRIERGTAFRITGGDMFDPAPLLPLIHDRMTEDVVESLAAADRLFDHVAPRPLARIPLLACGSEALVRANIALGLALSQDEIDYLATLLDRKSTRLNSSHRL